MTTPEHASAASLIDSDAGGHCRRLCPSFASRVLDKAKTLPAATGVQQSHSLLETTNTNDPQIFLSNDSAHSLTIAVHFRNHHGRF